MPWEGMTIAWIYGYFWGFYNEKDIYYRTIINYTKSQRIGWFGHVYRMPDERMVKKVYEWEHMAIRSLGRPKNRWENDVKNDLNIMRIRN